MLPCPSTRTTSASLAALQHQPLRRAGDEVGHHRVHRDPPALDHDAGLPGRHEAGADAALVELGVSWSCAVIFPTLQSVPTVSTTSGSTVLARPEAIGRSAGGRRRSKIFRPPAARLRGEQGIVAQKGVEPAPEIAAVIERLGQPARATRPASGRPAARCR